MRRHLENLLTAALLGAILATALLVLLVGCGLPIPPPQPPPHPDDCQYTGCPTGYECRDGACYEVPPEPPPPPLPEPQCPAVQQCGCYAGYVERTFPAGQVCTDNGNCVDWPEPPPPIFPVRFPLKTARIYLNDKAAGHGFDSTPRVEGDVELCQELHGTPEKNCHFESPKLGALRAEYEMRVLAGARAGDPSVGPMSCPVWWYSPAAQPSLVKPCYDNQNDFVSCDHFGSQPHQDDPKTPEFEGEPAQCGEQRNEFGPYAGFFTVAHGKGWIRTCPAGVDGKDNTRCGPFRTFEH